MLEAFANPLSMPSRIFQVSAVNSTAQRTRRTQTAVHKVRPQYQFISPWWSTRRGSLQQVVNVESARAACPQNDKSHRFRAQSCVLGHWQSVLVNWPKIPKCVAAPEASVRPAGGGTMASMRWGQRCAMRAPEPRQTRRSCWRGGTTRPCLHPSAQNPVVACSGQVVLWLCCRHCRPPLAVVRC